MRLTTENIEITGTSLKSLILRTRSCKMLRAMTVPVLPTPALQCTKIGLEAAHLSISASSRVRSWKSVGTPWSGQLW